MEEGSVVILISLGMIADARGSYEQAESSFMEVLHTMQVKGFHVTGPDALEGMAGVARAHRQFERAACLFGAARRLRAEIGAPASPFYHAWYEQQIALVKTALGNTAWSAAGESGQALTVEQAIDYALSGAALP